MAYEYSNFGYALVGRLITNISRRNYAEYIEAGISPAARHASDHL